MTSPGVLFRRTFAALGIRSFRLYFIGQALSVSGAWTQRIAQSWLVLELTDSGAAVGALAAVQFLPLLLLAPAGGLMADRMDKRKLLYITQTCAALIALTLGAVVLAGIVELWMVFVLAGALGLVGSVDNPARQSFVMEIVGRSRLTNAVALNQVLANSARIVGPAIGGLLIVTVGIGWCFVINAATYPAFIVALVAMRSTDIDRTEPVVRNRGQLRDAMRYIRGHRVLFTTLVMTAVFGLFAYEFEVVLPLLARFTFGGDADTFGLMFAAMGIGAIAGGLFVASRTNIRPRAVLIACFALSVSIAAAAWVPSLGLAYLTLMAVGVAVGAFLSLSNSVLQLGSAPDMRGRVVGLLAMTVLGTRPLGGPVIGWIGEHGGPRIALSVGAFACLGVGIWARSRLVDAELVDSMTPRVS